MQVTFTGSVILLSVEESYIQAVLMSTNNENDWTYTDAVIIN